MSFQRENPWTIRGENIPLITLKMPLFCHDDLLDGEQTIAVNSNQRVSANPASSAFYLLRNMTK